MTNTSVFFRHYERIIQVVKFGLIALWISIFLYLIIPYLRSSLASEPTKSKPSFKTEASDMTYTLINNKRTITIKGQKGHYLAKDVVNLSGEVTLELEDGTKLTSTNVHIKPSEKSVQGCHPISGDGPFGVVKAEGFSFDEAGEHLCLKGKSTLTLNDPS